MQITNSRIRDIMCVPGRQERTCTLYLSICLAHLHTCPRYSRHTIAPSLCRWYFFPASTVLRPHSFLPDRLLNLVRHLKLVSAGASFFLFLLHIPHCPIHWSVPLHPIRHCCFLLHQQLHISCIYLPRLALTGILARLCRIAVRLLELIALQPIIQLLYISASSICSSSPRSETRLEKGAQARGLRI